MTNGVSSSKKEEEEDIDKNKEINLEEAVINSNSINRKMAMMRKKIMIMGTTMININHKGKTTIEIRRTNPMLEKISNTRLKINNMILIKIEEEVEAEISKVKETIKESIMRLIHNVKS